MLNSKLSFFLSFSTIFRERNFGNVEEKHVGAPRSLCAREVEAARHLPAGGQAFAVPLLEPAREPARAGSRPFLMNCLSN